ncbi:hypothetical protein O6H91_14G034700 [Diphasiastrum complanatum]|nr:hypothetical protein O6H91_14G034700 [Diphasiastrum complanatum]
MESVSVLKQKFSSKGLSTVDLVSLTGAHTIGQTDCRFFSYRLYNFTSTGGADPSINTAYLPQLQQLCPPGAAAGTNKVALDKDSQLQFDAGYFNNIRQGNAVLEFDRRIFEDTSTQIYVDTFSGQFTNLVGVSFGTSFVNAMLAMSSIEVKTGTDGEIRRVCSKFN